MNLQIIYLQRGLIIGGYILSNTFATFIVLSLVTIVIHQKKDEIRIAIMTI